MKKLKILAGACALSVAVSMAGCSDTSWAIKYKSITIPSGVYLTYLLSFGEEAKTQTSQATASASSSSTSSKTSKSTDVWSQKIQGQNAQTWAINQAISACKQLALLEQMSVDNKVKLTAAEKSKADTSAKQIFQNNESIFKNNNIAISSFNRIYEDESLYEKVFEKIYGKGGSKAVSDDDLKQYYLKNYVHIKQIFVNKQNSSTGAALTGADLTKAQAKAQEALKAVSADKANFQKYVDQYNEDPGMKSNPDGYIFTKDDGYDQAFKDEALKLNIGDIGMAQSDMGFFIEYKQPLDTNAASFTSKKTDVLEKMKGTEFNNLMQNNGKTMKIDKNDGTINQFPPSKLKLQ